MGTGFRERWADRLARLSLRAALAACAALFGILSLLSAIAGLAWWLRTVWPGWAVWLALSGVFLLLAGIGLVWMRVSGREARTHRRSSAGGGEAGRAGEPHPLADPAVLSALSTGSPAVALALTLGETAGAAARKRPGPALAVALGVGLALGASPSLRRDLLALAGLAEDGKGKKGAQSARDDDPQPAGGGDV